MKTYYRRNLPHIQLAGAEYFVTFRLSGSLPKHVIQELRDKRKNFLKMNGKSPSLNHKQKIRRKIERNTFKAYEQLLNNEQTGNTWLKKPEITNIVSEAIHHRDQKEYDLYTYCIMSNHVHIVFRHMADENFHFHDNTTRIPYPVTKILKDLKSYTGLMANRLLGRTGSFWKSESYDHIIRTDQELENTIRYTLNNPVKANLVLKWEDWPYSYCKPEFMDSFL